MKTRLRRRTLGGALLATCLVVGATVAVATATGSRLIDQSLLAQFETSKAGPYPSVAFKVGTEPVSGDYLETAVTMFLQNSAAHGQSVSRGEAEQQIVERVRERFATAQAAESAGVSVTDQQVTDYLTNQEKLAQVDPDQSGIDAVMASHGDSSYAAYLADPSVRQHYRELLEMMAYVAPMAAGDSHFNLATFEASLASKVPVQLFFTIGSDAPTAGN